MTAIFCALLGTIHIWRSSNYLLFKTADPSSVHLRPKYFHTLDLGRPIWNKSPHLSNKLWNNNGTVDVNKRNQNKNKKQKQQNQVTPHSSWLLALLFDLSHKQCNGIIKGWLYCHKPESIERFLADNIFMFYSAWSLVMLQILFSLIIKRNYCTCGTFTTPIPYVQWHLIFVLTPPPVKMDAIFVLTLSIQPLFVWCLENIKKQQQIFHTIFCLISKLFTLGKVIFNSA